MFEYGKRAKKWLLLITPSAYSFYNNIKRLEYSNWVSMVKRALLYCNYLKLRKLFSLVNASYIYRQYAITILPYDGLKTKRLKKRFYTMFERVAISRSDAETMWREYLKSLGQTPGSISNKFTRESD